MLTITNKLSLALPYQFDPNMSIQPSDLLFFDIETTGLSADVSNIYLIGCCFYEDGCWQLIQWFADDYISEKAMLNQFMLLLSKHRSLVHFNGSGFDIPYIQKKLKQHKLTFSFADFLSIDLYKKIKPYKTLLNLPNVKQKSVEDFFGIARKDKFSGGELIDVYVNYMKTKFIQKQHSVESLNALLLHNTEDVSNLLLLLQVLAYSDIFEQSHEVIRTSKENSFLQLEFTLKNPIKNPLFYQTEQIIFSAKNNLVTLWVKTFEGELKYFYKNYKDYYYLPLEDTAIHKSVAQFVDKEHKEKAKAATCYMKKQGIFLPQFNLHVEPKFQQTIKDKNTYLELNHSLLSNQQKLSNYVMSVLKAILNHKK